MANKHFYPPIEPYQTGTLEVDQPHFLYWEQCGNPNGEPVLFLHGGPGAGCTELDRCFFDPEHFRIILFDQRGCGRSSPIGELSNNTMSDSARDIELLRETLGIERWHVFGGSYGSTLSLFYSQRFPERCKSLVLRGIWLLRREEIDWWLHRAGMVQPELWDAFAEFIPENERDDLLEAYWKRLTGDDRELALEAAKHWAIYETACCTLLPNEEFLGHFAADDTAWAVARLEAHYFRNVNPDPDTLLLDQVDTYPGHPRLRGAWPLRHRLSDQEPAGPGKSLARTRLRSGARIGPFIPRTGHYPGAGRSHQANSEIRKPGPARLVAPRTRRPQRGGFIGNRDRWLRPRRAWAVIRWIPEQRRAVAVLVTHDRLAGSSIALPLELGLALFLHFLTHGGHALLLLSNAVAILFRIIIGRRAVFDHHLFTPATSEGGALWVKWETPFSSTQWKTSVRPRRCRPPKTEPYNVSICHPHTLIIGSFF